MARPDDDSHQSGIREELAEIREKQAEQGKKQVEQGVEIKWTKWLAGGALGASTLGQLTKLGPPTAVFDVIGRLF